MTRADAAELTRSPNAAIERYRDGCAETPHEQESTS